MACLRGLASHGLLCIWVFWQWPNWACLFARTNGSSWALFGGSVEHVPKSSADASHQASNQKQVGGLQATLYISAWGMVSWHRVPFLGDRTRSWHVSPSWRGCPHARLGTKLLKIMMWRAWGSPDNLSPPSGIPSPSRPNQGQCQRALLDLPGPATSGQDAWALACPDLPGLAQPNHQWRLA